MSDVKVWLLYARLKRKVREARANGDTLRAQTLLEVTVDLEQLMKEQKIEDSSCAT